MIFSFQETVKYTNYATLVKWKMPRRHLGFE